MTEEAAGVYLLRNIGNRQFDESVVQLWKPHVLCLTHSVYQQGIGMIFLHHLIAFQMAHTFGLKYQAWKVRLHLPPC